LTLQASDFPLGRPGQFVLLGPHNGTAGADVPFLRRAFSIAGLRRTREGCELDLFYRVVGAGTGWLAGLQRGDHVDLIGPLGNAFPMPAADRTAWLVAGGVGLPPVWWLAQELAELGRSTVLFVGARRQGQIPLSVHQAGDSFRADRLPDTDLVLATDDGSAGFHGTVVEALAERAGISKVDLGSITVFTCGPEAMLRAVAELCAARSMTCHVCLERSMACGIGTCQSCVVRVRDPADSDGWRYVPCCTEGPVFDASEVIWDE
jgi:dihydroorotate dehydrogenase electron transfer subunit